MTKEYTAFPDEDEILIQDGLSYRITDIRQKYNNDYKPNALYYQITLKYPVGKQSDPDHKSNAINTDCSNFSDDDS